MKKEVVFLPTAACLLLLGIALNFVFGQREVVGQTTAVATKPVAVKPVKPASNASNIYSPAAEQNAKLRDSLAWGFGGKTQKGWNIYAPLISYTIGTDSTSDSAEFSAALAKWQENNRLASTGVLDKATMEAFVGYWQTRRLRRSGAPAPNALFSAPIVEFFDPTRSPDLLQLERETYALTGHDRGEIGGGARPEG